MEVNEQTGALYASAISTEVVKEAKKSFEVNKNVQRSGEI